jgi:SAM-dependent methyltransferase
VAMKRVVGAWRSFIGARSKKQWILRKYKNWMAKPKIEAAWAEFVERLPRENAINAEFDRRHGTDTAGEVELVETGVSAKDAAGGNERYRTIWESSFHAALAALGLDFEGFTFVDIGSGKGKLLLLAASYPFERIVGVEYSPGLHAIAERNIGVYRSASQRCANVVAILGNALAFELPQGPIVCFIFNALDGRLMRAFMQNVESGLARRSQPAFVIYGNLRHVGEIGDAFDDVRLLKKLKESDKLLIFGNTAAGALLAARAK